MSNEFIQDGRNRCKRCNRPLSNSNDLYGWRCAQIIGIDNYQRIASTLDEDALKGYNAYVVNYLKADKNELKENFTTKGKNYTNSFVREKTEDSNKVKYSVISNVSVLGETFQVEYMIDGGVVRFGFENNDDYWSILWRGGGKTLAKAIYDAGRSLSSDNLSGRTVDGINAELQLHWAAHKAGIRKENAKTADIGGVKEPGIDNNAWVFEAIQLTEDIVNPKAKDVIDSVKELWGYLKK